MILRQTTTYHVISIHFIDSSDLIVPCVKNFDNSQCEINLVISIGLSPTKSHQMSNMNISPSLTKFKCVLLRV